MNHYTEKFDISRTMFIKIYHLYQSLGFITAFKKIHKGFQCPLGDTPGSDYKKIPEIQKTGVDMHTLLNDSFPALKYENTLFIDKLFKEMETQIDIKTSKHSD